MDSSVVPIASLILSAIAVLCGVAALLRAGKTSASVAGLSELVRPLVSDGKMQPELSGLVDELDDKINAVALQFERLEGAINELQHARREDLETSSVSQPPPALISRAILAGTSEPALSEETLEMGASLIATLPTTIASGDPPKAPLAEPAMLDSSIVDIEKMDELVAGYRAKIGERSKAPIREWLTQNNSVMLEVNDDGSLMPSESGLIAAIPLTAGTAILVPTAGFVVDFATRFAGSQISLRQVMRNTFEAIVDNSGDMKLQAPAMARREGERWIIVKPGCLSGFTDS